MQTTFRLKTSPVHAHRTQRYSAFSVAPVNNSSGKRSQGIHCSQTQTLFDKLARDTGAKQHAHDHPIQKVFNLRHALVPIAQGSVDTVVPFCAYRFMYSQSCIHRFHKIP
jgi:hypothetical protein